MYVGANCKVQATHICTDLIVWFPSASRLFPAIQDVPLSEMLSLLLRVLSQAEHHTVTATVSQRI